MAVVQVWTINSGRALLIAAARNDVSVLACSMYVCRKTKVGPKLSFPSFFLQLCTTLDDFRGFEQKTALYYSGPSLGFSQDGCKGF